MVTRIGVCTAYLLIPESQSLKDKRRVVKSLLAKLGNRFNIAVSEIGDLDTPKRSVIGIVSISNDSRHLNQMLSKVVEFIEKMNLAILVDYEIDLSY